MTRDKRLQVWDEQLQREREVPLGVVRQIECSVQKEWMEKEWRFAESASDAKVYTGRAYPAREYTHTVTLEDGRKLTGPLAEILYVQPLAASPDAAGRGPAGRSPTCGAKNRDTKSLSLPFAVVIIPLAVALQSPAKLGSSISIWR